MADQAFWPVMLGFLMGASLTAMIAIAGMSHIEPSALEAVRQALPACKEIK